MPTLGRYTILTLDYDQIVIGSSPFNLINLLSQMEKGNALRVAVISRDSELGGSWSVSKVNEELYENAAHLIEALPDVYEIIEYYTGEKFVAPNVQPMRLLKIGLTIKILYHSKIMIILAFFRIVSDYFTSMFGTNEEKKKNSLIKLRHWIDTGLPFLFKNLPEIKIPERGYAKLMASLIDNCRMKGVDFIQDEVIQINQDPKTKFWRLKTKYISSELKSQSLSISSSIALKKTNNKICLIKDKISTRSIIILEINDQFLKFNISYVSLFNNKYIKRVVNIDELNPNIDKRRYLFELKPSVSEAFQDNCIVLTRILIDSGLFRSSLRFKKLHHHISTYGYSHQFYKEDLPYNLHVNDSVGNLAVAIFKNRKLLKI